MNAHARPAIQLFSYSVSAPIGKIGTRAENGESRILTSFGKRPCLVKRPSKTFENHYAPWGAKPRKYCSQYW